MANTKRKRSAASIAKQKKTMAVKRANKIIDVKSFPLDMIPEKGKKPKKMMPKRSVETLRAEIFLELLKLAREILK